MTRDLEKEREQLMGAIMTSVPETVREALRVSRQLRIEPKVTVSTNEVGSEHANSR